jgi:hypothetical protein
LYFVQFSDLGVYGTIAYRDKEVVGVFVRFSSCAASSATPDSVTPEAA